MDNMLAAVLIALISLAVGVFFGAMIAETVYSQSCKASVPIHLQGVWYECKPQDK